MNPVGGLRELGRMRLVAVVVLVVAGSVGGAFGLGLVGVPAVETVENHFSSVSQNTTTVGTALTVSNPNPVGVRLGGTDIEYTVSMNDVPIAGGEKAGLALTRGNTTLNFSTRMRNGQIPAWWVTHVANGERTRVTIDANVSHSVLGDRSVSLTQNRTVETDIMGQFNSTETRPVDADRPLISDPVLYINETRGSWDRGNLTDAQTPIDVAFDVYNPKPVPYTVTKIGYTTRMNDIRVGRGETDRSHVIAPGERETIGVRTVIDNDRLDQWWVSHLRRNQRTTMYIDFYIVVEGAGEQFRIDLDAIDYETTIETDIFGNKAQYPTGRENIGSEGGSGGTGDSDETATPEGSASGTATPTDDGTGATTDDPATATPTDDGGLVGGTL